jgi:hypothetical protein
LTLVNGAVALKIIQDKSQIDAEGSGTDNRHMPENRQINREENAD